MDKHNSKVTIHMVASLDGFIAKKDGNIDWLTSKDEYEKGITLTDEAITKFIEGIGCYVMGAKTYEHALVLGWPYGDKPVFVLTSRNLPISRPSVRLHHGDLTNLINNQLKSQYSHIWMAGGAALTKSFVQLNLVDEIIVSILPILIGEGTLYFDYIGKEQPLHLKDVIAYKDGMVELTYNIKKGTNRS